MMKNASWIDLTGFGGVSVGIRKSLGTYWPDVLMYDVMQGMMDNAGAVCSNQ